MPTAGTVTTLHCKFFPFKTLLPCLEKEWLQISETCSWVLENESVLFLCQEAGCVNSHLKHKASRIKHQELPFCHDFWKNRMKTEFHMGFRAYYHKDTFLAC